MKLFLSSFTNRMDKKGRVSVPSPFRALVQEEGGTAVFASSSLRFDCIECCGAKYFDKLHRMIEDMPAFSDQRDAFSAALFGDTTQLGIDGEGRISVPQSLIAYAHIKEEILFVGKGETFEMWNPEAYADIRASARDTVRNLMRQKGGAA